MPRRPRSVTVPVALTALAAGLTVALLVGWTLLLADALSGRVWLLVLGLAGFAAVLTVLVVTGAALALRIREARAQVRFIDAVTHELKSPLASLALGLDTLARPDLPDGTRGEIEGMMRADVERLGAFVDDVLAASRLDTERRPPAAVVTPVAEVVAAVVRRVRRRHAEGPEPRIAVEVPPDLAIATDRTGLETVLVNLVDNAVRYSPVPADVRVVAEAGPRGGVVLTVTDQGVGFAPPEARRIFRRFYRADDPAVRSRSGTGLGLFVAAETTRALGGRLSASSPGPGLGATFRLALPNRSRGAGA